MKILHKFNTFFIFLLAALYLFLPVGNLLNGAPSEFADGAAVTVIFSSDSSPCGECPCHQEQKESGCCDTGHGCSCHTTPPSSISDNYSPTIIATGFFERPRKARDVYLQIFVPPQNYA